MGTRVDWDDVIGTTGVAEILGLTRSSSVNTYRKRHSDFPEPRKMLSPRCPAWHRKDIERWMRARERKR